MTQETYRFAYEEANAELREIVGQFEVLKARKEQVEQVVEALRAVMDDVFAGPALSLAGLDLAGLDSSQQPGAGERAPFLVFQASEMTPEQKRQMEQTPEPMAFPEPAVDAEPVFAESSDPFQRRIDNALRHGLGSKESRILPRGLSGLLSRA